MASDNTAALTPRDQVSIAEAQALARRAKAAQLVLAELSQAQIDGLVDAMAAAALAEAEPLARLACEETGYGVVADKVQKNLFAARDVHAFIRPMITVGVVARHEARRVVDIAEPFGVVAGIVPSTNPTSTAIYKLLISIKARCAVVLSPHPAAARCITRTAQIMTDAASRAGLPDGAIGWMSTVSLEGTQALMRAREVAVILATGGMGLVRAAYSAGKPAYGVGPGNAPCYVEASADIAKAADDILAGKCFDNGVLCSSPNSVVVDRAVAPALRAAFQAGGGHFLSVAETARLAAALVTPGRLPNPAFVGKSAVHIAAEVGIPLPAGTRALIAPLGGVGRDHPLSIEKLCPVLSYYEVADWREGCERSRQILRYGGMGHTMSIHSRNDQIILEFGLHKPAYRICVNTPTTHGAIGLTTGLDPAMTLGCGGYGGNITSDNISPRHLLNIKRLAYELRPRPGRAATRATAPGRDDGGRSGRGPRPAAGATPLGSRTGAGASRQRLDRPLSGDARRARAGRSRGCTAGRTAPPVHLRRRRPHGAPHRRAARRRAAHHRHAGSARCRCHRRRDPVDRRSYHITAASACICSTTSGTGPGLTRATRACYGHPSRRHATTPFLLARASALRGLRGQPAASRRHSTGPPFPHRRSRTCADAGRSDGHAHCHGRSRLRARPRRSRAGPPARCPGRLRPGARHPDGRARRGPFRAATERGARFAHRPHQRPRTVGARARRRLHRDGLRAGHHRHPALAAAGRGGRRAGP